MVTIKAEVCCSADKKLHSLSNVVTAGALAALAKAGASSLVSLAINLAVLERESKHTLPEDCMHHIIFTQVTQASLSVWRYEIALTHSDSIPKSCGKGWQLM